MKARNLNNASAKTQKLIKQTFLQMLDEKKQIDKISVSELAKRADISRAAFYSHYDDIYGVVEEFETEIIDEFFTNVRLLSMDNPERFFEELFEFMRKNNDNYKMMCKSNDMLFSAKRLTSLVINKFLELCNNDSKIIDRRFIEIDISIFVEGLMCEYIKYCRELTTYSITDLHDYAQNWYADFIAKRCIK